METAVGMALEMAKGRVLDEVAGVGLEVARDVAMDAVSVVGLSSRRFQNLVFEWHAHHSLAVRAHRSRKFH